MADVPAANTANPQSNSPLSKIPVELLVRITYFISTKDLGNMRLSCKAIERSLFNFFSHEFFHKKQFMAQTISLQALMDISKHPSLGPCLKHVIITTDRYDENGGPPPTRAIQLFLDQVRDDHNNLMSTGLLRDYLAEAFANLPNLETVDLRDFNSPTRNRDRGWWCSYGVNTLQDRIGYPPNIEGGLARSETQKYRSQLFQAIIAALATANARPKALEVVLRAQGLLDSSFYIPDRLQPSIAQVLSGLNKLHLVLLPPRSFQSLVPWSMTNVKKFLRLASNITWLRLNMSYERQISEAQRDDVGGLFNWICGLNWDGSAPLEDADDAPPSFELEVLDLGSTSLLPAHLHRLVVRFSKKLNTLSLRRVALRSKPEQDADKINVWANLIRSFSKVPSLELRKLSIAWVRQGPMAVSLSTGMERQFKAATTAKLVEQVAADIRPLWPTPPRTDEDVEGEDEEEVGSDEDEDDEEEEEEDEEE